MIKHLSGYLYKIGNEAGEKRKRNILALVEKNQNAYYLDCGSATGELTKKIAGAIDTKHIFGVDRDPTYIEKAGKKGVKVEKGDLNEQIPFKDETFDVITAIEVIEHLYNTDVFLQEIYRVLKKGGYAIIGTENLASWHNVFALVLGHQPSTGPHVSSLYPIGFHPLYQRHIAGRSSEEIILVDKHINVVTRNALRRLVISHGFLLENEKPSGFYPFSGFLSDIFAKLDSNHAVTILLKIRKQ